MQAHLLENPDELLEITEMSHSIELVILAHPDHPRHIGAVVVLLSCKHSSTSTTRSHQRAQGILVAY